MKQTYTKPEMEIIRFDTEDVIATSIPDPEVNTPDESSWSQA